MKILIEGERVRVETPEGTVHELPVRAFQESLVADRFETGGIISPDGVLGLFPLRRAVVVVHQTPPVVRRLKWLAANSRAPYGPRARYRDVSLALPYVVVLAVFIRDPRGRVQLTSKSEAFFSRVPLQSPDDELCYPALLNCSRFEPAADHPLAWICVQNLDLSETCGSKSDDSARLRAGLGALLRHLYETGFNRSSEVHEGSSWFEATVSAQVDERLADVEAWERASLADGSFALDVPWLPTGLSVRDVVDRIAGSMGGRETPLVTADDLARGVINCPDSERDEHLIGLSE
jgi:hypothetical protein